MKGAASIPVVTLGEWQTQTFEGLSLTPADRPLAEKIGTAHGGRVTFDELKAGLRVSAKSWIGVIRFSSFELRIVPKLAGDHLDLVRFIDFASGLDCLRRFQSTQEVQGGSDSLLDLIALLFAEACEWIARNGLLADYREVEEDLPVVRGRILLDRQHVRRFGMMNRVECRFDDQLTDIPENQLLLAALLASVRRVSSASVAVRLRRLLNIFAGTCSLDDVDLAGIRTTLVYHRLNEHYRSAHGLAWLLLDGLGVRELLSGGDRDCFAFLLNMNHLFERFVFRWLSTVLSGTGLRVTAQQHARSILWDADAGAPYKHIRPDLLVRAADSGFVLPIDAKYKLYDEADLAMGDVYQSFLYAFAWGDPSRARTPAAILIYPSSSCSPGQTRLHVRNQRGSLGAELLAMGIHIPSALTEASTGGQISTAVRETIAKHLGMIAREGA